jgi:Na+(H+)/acetate symporter ActP
MLPIFIVNYLPAGIMGLLLVAVFSAAMASAGGAINSLSAASLKDVVIPYFKKNMDGDTAYKWSIGLTVFWGILCTLAVVFARIAPTVIEAVNKVGSLFFGCILGVFILGMCTKRTCSTGAKTGLVLGLLVNLYLWLGVPELSWLWWNLTGFIVTVITGYLASILILAASEKKVYFLGTVKWAFVFALLWSVVYQALTTIVQDYNYIAGMTMKISFILIGLTSILVIEVWGNRININNYVIGLLLGLLANIVFWFFNSGFTWIFWSLTALFVASVFTYFIFYSKVREKTSIDSGLLISRESMIQPGLKSFSTVLISACIIMIALVLIFTSFS